ncbi:MAG: DUF5320 domain-containing protein [Methanolinea sp.]|nr:DUF5320 domain-containing protein [Methanolinea sp.]
MPGLDGTGPLGRGPMTGWGMGRCRPYGVAPFSPQTQQQPAPAAEQGTQEPSGQGSAGTAAPRGYPFVAPRGYPFVYGRGRGGIPRGCGRGWGRGRCWRFFW